VKHLRGITQFIIIKEMKLKKKKRKLRSVKENVCVSLQNSVGLFEFYDCLLVNQKLCFL